MACSGSVGFSQASSSSQMWRGGGGRINSGRKWLSIGGFGPLTKDSVIREATELSNPELEESGSGSLRMLGKLALLWVGSSD